MIITRGYLESIKPKKSKVSDKYNWNLYRFLNGFKNYDIHFYRVQLHTTIVTISTEIGYHAGCRVYSILNAGSKANLRDLLKPYITTEYNFSTSRDITEEFLSGYQKDGRCYFDKEHIVWRAGGDERFTVIDDNHKVCNWCGKHLHKIVRERVVKDEIWEIREEEEEKPHM